MNIADVDDVPRVLTMAARRLQEGCSIYHRKPIWETEAGTVIQFRVLGSITAAH